MIEWPLQRGRRRRVVDDETCPETLRRLREVRARHGIDTSSPVNLFLATGRSLVATRFSFDYGWYPDEDSLLETDLPYCSLWYTVEGAPDALRAVLIASEPLTIDTSGWLELPEYSMITATAESDALEFRTLDLDA